MMVEIPLDKSHERHADGVCTDADKQYDSMDTRKHMNSQQAHTAHSKQQTYLLHVEWHVCTQPGVGTLILNDAVQNMHSNPRCFPLSTLWSNAVTAITLRS